MKIATLKPLTGASAFVLTSLATPLSAATFLDTFSGNALNPAIWNPTPFTENQGMITPTNDRLEFTAGPGAALIDSNHYGTYTSFGLLNGLSDWTAQVSANLAPLADFGTFPANETLFLTLGIENSADTSDNIELSFAAGDPFGTGAGKSLRYALKTEDVNTMESSQNLFGDVGAVDLEISYNAASGLVSVSFDDGTGSVSLANYDISAWNLGSDEAFNVFLTGGAISTASTIQSGTFEITSGEAYFDDFSATLTDAVIPEPSTAVLGALAMLGLLRRRRA